MHHAPVNTTRKATAVLALALALVSCKKPLTHLVVEVDTDVPMSALPELTFQCGYDWDGRGESGSAAGCELLVTRGPGGEVSARVCLPASFGVRIDPRNEGRALTLVVSGASDRYRRIATVTPPTGEVRLLRLRLRQACLTESAASDSHPCPASASARCTLAQSCVARGQTCGDDGACAPATVPAESLTVIAREGPQDAGLTAAVDGQCPLSGFGEGPPDASSPQDAATLRDGGG
jgi:hypothetical protein